MDKMSMDGPTYTQALLEDIKSLLEDIKSLLVLQLIKSGIPGKDIAPIFYYGKKEFLRSFPWATWEGE